MDDALKTTAFRRREAESQPGVHTTARRQVAGLTGLRFFAALFILLGHSSAWMGKFSDSALLSEWIGEPVAVFAMPLFFVLSGFVIHYNYATLFSTTKLKWATAEFFGHRIARLWPLYLFGMAIGATAQMLISWLGHYTGSLAIVLAHDLTGTQSWFYAVFFNQLLLFFAFGLGWSVSVELFFYVCYIFVARPIAALRRPKAIVVAWLICAGVGLIVSYLAAEHLPYLQTFGTRHIKGAILDGDHSWGRWLLYYSPYMRVLEFLLGALTAQAHLVLAARKPSATEQSIGRIALIGSLAVLGTISLAWATRGAGDVVQNMLLNFGCAAPIALLMFCIARYQSGLRDWLDSGPLTQLGELSYSIYVMHTWILWSLMRPAAPTNVLTVTDAVLRMLVGIALTLIIATATYRLIEVPGRRWLRSYFSTTVVATLGPRDKHLLAASTVLPKADAVRPLLGLAIFLAACVAYQFLAVPRYP